MSVYETVGRNQKQALLALHHSHQAVLDVMKPFMGRTAPVWRMVKELPDVDRVTVKERVEQWFGFVEDVLKEQKEFTLHIVEMLPEHTATHVVKSTPKAA